ncbi:MAG: Rrf2 family transcriptional regulator [Oscillospiraceae bacterium]|nr:Rrf2 family transcriptional regulator [Oscillospiraceae bacterium]
MIVSTRGRYALRVIIDLAEHGTTDYVAMREIAARQGISLKYLEKILPALVAGKLIEGVHGKGGGYRLTRPPEEITAGQILRLTEGDLSPVACLSCDADACERTAECRTRPMWAELNRLINSYLDGITVAGLMQTK